jgi:hypothetical protein
VDELSRNTLVYAAAGEYGEVLYGMRKAGIA